MLDTASLKSFLDRLVNTPDLLSRVDIATVATQKRAGLPT